MSFDIRPIAPPINDGVIMQLEEARAASVEEKRADLIRSAARGQGPTFIAAKLDYLIESVREEGLPVPADCNPQHHSPSFFGTSGVLLLVAFSASSAAAVTAG